MTRLKISRVFRTTKKAMRACGHLSRWFNWLASSRERPLTELELKEFSVSLSETVLEIGVS
jgi:hypothetical protein